MSFHSFSVFSSFTFCVLGGETLDINELNALADQVALEPRDKEEEARLRKQLGSKRLLDRVGLRSNHLSAAADSRAVVSKFQDEVRTSRCILSICSLTLSSQAMNLFERTGTRCIAMFTRGHVDDGFIPTYVESGDSMDFFIQTYKTPGLDYVRHFEQWSCLKDRSES